MLFAGANHKNFEDDEPLHDEPRQQFFDQEPYQYSSNPFNYLATASWSKNARTEAQKPV